MQTDSLEAGVRPSIRYYQAVPTVESTGRESIDFKSRYVPVGCGGGGWLVRGGW